MPKVCGRPGTGSWFSRSHEVAAGRDSVPTPGGVSAERLSRHYANAVKVKASCRHGLPASSRQGCYLGFHRETFQAEERPVLLCYRGKFLTLSTYRRDRPMQRIVPAILSLQQHRDSLEREPVIYWPVACPHCGLATLWGHGCYERKADRRPEPSGSLNPVFIPRFFCQGCRQTCSRLPECIAPRRWYGWAVQQVVLLWLLAGGSLHQAAGQGGMDRRSCMIGKPYFRFGNPMCRAVDFPENRATFGLHESARCPGATRISPPAISVRTGDPGPAGA